jgi:hypothetical protein
MAGACAKANTPLLYTEVKTTLRASIAQRMRGAALVSIPLYCRPPRPVNGYHPT